VSALLYVFLPGTAHASAGFLLGALLVHAGRQAALL
jgi:hypothetical protein